MLGHDQASVDLSRPLLVILCADYGFDLYLTTLHVKASTSCQKGDQARQLPEV